MTCIIQVTGSAGFKEGYRLRLWFWLDHPTTGDKLKIWCKPALDRKLLDDVTLRECQPHYIGVRVVGREDPCPHRFRLLRGQTDTVQVPDIGGIKLRQEHAEREERRRRNAARARPSPGADHENYGSSASLSVSRKSGRPPKQKSVTRLTSSSAPRPSDLRRYGVDWSITKSQLIDAYESLFSRTDANRREKGSTLGVLAWLEGSDCLEGQGGTDG